MMQPDGGKFLAFDHVTFWVSNAKQAASYYTTRFGFEYFAYQGLETGSRQYAKHVVKQNEVLIYANLFLLFNFMIFTQIIFVFVSPYDTGNYGEFNGVFQCHVGFYNFR